MAAMQPCGFVNTHVSRCVLLCGTALVQRCMYVCMHVCMYACMHVCMYACMHVCMYACTYVRMYVCAYVCLHICTYVRMYVSHRMSVIAVVCVVSRASHCTTHFVSGTVERNTSQARKASHSWP